MPSLPQTDAGSSSVPLPSPHISPNHCSPPAPHRSRQPIPLIPLILANRLVSRPVFHQGHAAISNLQCLVLHTFLTHSFYPTLLLYSSFSPSLLPSLFFLLYLLCLFFPTPRRRSGCSVWWWTALVDLLINMFSYKEKEKKGMSHSLRRIKKEQKNDNVDVTQDSLRARAHTHTHTQTPKKHTDKHTNTELHPTKKQDQYPNERENKNDTRKKIK